MSKMLGRTGIHAVHLSLPKSRHSNVIIQQNLNNGPIFLGKLDIPKNGQDELYFMQLILPYLISSLTNISVKNWPSSYCKKLFTYLVLIAPIKTGGFLVFKKPGLV